MSGNPRLCWSFMEMKGRLSKDVNKWCLTTMARKKLKLSGSPTPHWR